jgi:hypothetical protein
VSTFVVELYLASEGDARLQDAGRSLDGPCVRHVRTIFIPGDEMCFLVLEAPSARVIRDAAARSHVTLERVVDAVEIEASAPASWEVSNAARARTGDA